MNLQEEVAKAILEYHVITPGKDDTIYRDDITQDDLLGAFDLYYGEDYYDLEEYNDYNDETHEMQDEKYRHSQKVWKNKIKLAVHEQCMKMALYTDIFDMEDAPQYAI